MHPRKIAQQELEANGYTKIREGGNHMIYFNPHTRATIPLKRSKFTEHDLKTIRKEINNAKTKAGA